MLERFTWFRQSAYRWDGDDAVVYVDPWGVTDPRPADVVLITHAHDDHFSRDDLERIRGERTRFVAPHDVARELSGDVTPVGPGDRFEIGPVLGTAVPAYNVAEERLQMHPEANGWVGYVLELGGRTYYHAGDTDHLQELESVRTDVAFLPVGGTFTMDAVEAAGLAKAIAPRLAVPMHYGFIVGGPSDADLFAKEADPVAVEILTPTNPFERR